MKVNNSVIKLIKSKQEEMNRDIAKLKRIKNIKIKGTKMRLKKLQDQLDQINHYLSSNFIQQDFESYVKLLHERLLVSTKLDRINKLKNIKVRGIK